MFRDMLRVWSNEGADMAREGGWSQNMCGLECCAVFPGAVHAGLEARSL